MKQESQKHLNGKGQLFFKWRKGLEMPQWFRALAALPKDPGSIPSTLIATQYHLPVTPFPQDFLWPLWAPETHKAQDTQTGKTSIKLKFIF